MNIYSLAVKSKNCSKNYANLSVGLQIAGGIGRKSESRFSLWNLSLLAQRKFYIEVGIYLKHIKLV